MSSLLGGDVKCVITTLQTKKNHRDKKHPQRKGDSIDAPSAKKVRYDLEVTLPHLGFTVEEKRTLQCSYKVAYRIMKCKKPHTIAEKLIKPCAEKMVEILIGSRVKTKTQQVSLFNDIIRRRIDDMAVNVCQQVCSEVNTRMPGIFICLACPQELF